MTKTKYTIVAVLVAAVSMVQAFAGTATKQVAPISLESSSKLTGSLETSYVSNYTYRGQVLDSNPVLVPTLAVNYSLFTGGSLQLSTDQIVGTKGSTLYRSKYDIGLALTLGRFVVTPGYEIAAYPGRDGVNTQGVTGRVSFDDSGLLPLTLNPYVHCSKDVDPNGGFYYEAGVAPGKKFGRLTASVPVAFGVSSSSYYGSANKNLEYAYTSVGLSLVYNLNDRLALKVSSTYFDTDKSLGNSSSSFVQNSAGVSVSF